MNIKKTTILAALIFLIVGAFVAETLIKKETDPSVIFFENQKLLGKMVKNKGIYQTYSYFRSNFKKYDPSTNHYLGHYLGEQAYKILDEKGFDVCDFGLDYGCIHGFVIAGINEKGKGFFDTVMDKCKSIDVDDVSRGSCIHGVSHTVLSLKGYKFDDLKWALNKCDNLLKDDVSDGPGACYSAVFMEFNLMSLDGEKNGNWFVTRKFDDTKPIYPCDGLDVRYQWACFSELGSFWSNSFDLDFGRMATYCNLADVKKSKEGCYWGVGRTMADLYKYDVPKIGAECKRISQATLISSCIRGASVVMLNNGVKNAPQICDYLTADDKTSCDNFFKNNKSLN
ncbi:MAG TPA: hypothetical protein VFI61_00215 [Patescibacteria group bacterium]|nr:hypothetical protein [Patescibacteria group bacterium]